MNTLEIARQSYELAINAERTAADELAEATARHADAKRERLAWRAYIRVLEGDDIPENAERSVRNAAARNDENFEAIAARYADRLGTGGG